MKNISTICVIKCVSSFKKHTFKIEDGILKKIDFQILYPNDIDSSKNYTMNVEYKFYK